jgi:hypothetical protein
MVFTILALLVHVGRLILAGAPAHSITDAAELFTVCVIRSVPAQGQILALSLSGIKLLAVAVSKRLVKFNFQRRH